MSLRELQNYVFISKYANWNESKKRRETWKESVERVKGMMLKKYPHVAEEIEWAYDLLRKDHVYGSQRALQFGGKPIEKINERMYNCFKENTSFITRNGVRSFIDFADGDIVTVLTHKGNWKEAVVRSYSSQQLNKVVLKRRNNTQEVFCTANHRWILSNGNITTSLSVGDKIKQAPSIFKNFDYDNCEIDEKLYWAYGFVFGDGTVVKNGGQYTHSMVRLCGCDSKYISRFQELGFSSSQPLSAKGDYVVYTGKYLKTAPNPEVDDPRLIRAFVRGYLDADGTKNSNVGNDISKFIRIQSSDQDHIDFIRRCFPIAGVYIVSEKELTGQETNYGVRPYTVSFCINDNINEAFTVVSIEKDDTELVWCLEVEDDNSFVLPFGLSTGNCVSSYCDRPRFFQECLFLLLCGCGAGFSVQKHHIAKLPKINYRTRGTKTFVVPDSIEGWADALGVLISSFVKNPEDAPFPEYSGYIVEFDFSLVRPAGSRLGSCLGKAPGPEPLSKALNQIEQVLNLATDDRGYLKPIEAYDIVMYAADAVVSGGVRRSATICIFSDDDEEMLAAKTGNWREENEQRGRSNNSVLLLRNKVSLEKFKAIVEHTKEYGEPGFIWADDLEALFNPCVEIGFYAYDKDGNSGWQGCNLSGVNWGKINTREEFLDACKAAAYIGTWQAGFTDFKYLGKVSEEIFRREALLGVSMTGIMEKPELALDPDLQRQGAETVMAANEYMSKKIGINSCARGTCLKPEGSNSARLGTSSGIHTHPAKRFIRHVQANFMEKPYQLMAEVNPLACEPSVWSSNGTDGVIKFAVEVPDGSKLRNQMPALELLAAVKSTQINWVMQGKNVDRCTKPWLSNNVSNTITVKDEEWDDVSRYIYDNRDYFTAVSLLAYCGDKDYPQAPFTSVHTAREIVSEYGDGSVFASGLIEDALRYFNNRLWDACDTVLGISSLGKEIDDLWEHNRSAFNELEGTINYLNRKRLWVERAKKFADKYFDGDIKKMTYCLKDVYNWKIYCDLKREYKHVDYTLLQESEDNTNHIQDVACRGGACEISW